MLDVVTYIQRALDPTLAYRFACRVGMCGSCAMTVNGVARWTCRTHVAKVAADGASRSRRSRNLPVIRDLVTDMREVLRQVGAGEAAVSREPRRARRLRARDARVAGAAPRSMPAIECIGCGVCYASCDVVAGARDYLGPAALNRAWTLVNDVRDAGSASACARSPAMPAATPATRRTRAPSAARSRSTPTAAHRRAEAHGARAALEGEL